MGINQNENEEHAMDKVKKCRVSIGEKKRQKNMQREE